MQLITQSLFTILILSTLLYIGCVDSINDPTGVSSNKTLMSSKDHTAETTTVEGTSGNVKVSSTVDSDTAKYLVYADTITTVVLYSVAGALMFFGMYLMSHKVRRKLESSRSK